MVADNRAGASGNIGMDQLAKAKPDGYTLAINNVALAVNPALFAKLPFDTARDFASVGTMGTSQHVLVVNNALPAKNVKELIALAKAQPGKLSFGSAGSGSTFHMAAELFKRIGRGHHARAVQGRRSGAGRHDGRPGADEFSGAPPRCRRCRPASCARWR
jgi:tripartite-type tricarboxylate transporter receptor subunit TctC